jgi:hypothetical protein
MDGPLTQWISMPVMLRAASLESKPSHKQSTQPKATEMLWGLKTSFE